MAGFFKSLAFPLLESMDIEQIRLTRILRVLKERGALPLNIELTSVADGFFASVFDHVSSDIISEEVSIGFDASPALASLKGVVEFLERRAFHSGHKGGLASCQTDRSDGFAAFPLSLRSRRQAKKIARANAYNEALERYCWATWWDSPSVKYQLLPATHFLNRGSLTEKIIEAAGALVAFETLRVVLLEPSNSSQVVVVLLSETSDGGFVTGGAAGERSDLQTVLQRAAAELYRHCLALERMRNSGTRGESFYQRRLAYFGFGDGAEQVRRRLSYHGQMPIELPPLLIDQEIPQSQSDIVYVHRCLFQNQPPFVGGDLGRLCI
jgi:hypothetical protein